MGTVFNILVTFKDIEYLGKLIMGPGYLPVHKDTCLFPSSGMRYLVAPYASRIA